MPFKLGVAVKAGIFTRSLKLLQPFVLVTFCTQILSEISPSASVNSNEKMMLEAPEKTFPLTDLKVSWGVCTLPLFKTNQSGLYGHGGSAYFVYHQRPLHQYDRRFI